MNYLGIITQKKNQTWIRFAPPHPFSAGVLLLSTILIAHVLPPQRAFRGGRA
jgi:hypothetical protein